MSPIDFTVDLLLIIFVADVISPSAAHFFKNVQVYTPLIKYNLPLFIKALFMEPRKGQFHNLFIILFLYQEMGITLNADIRQVN